MGRIDHNRGEIEPGGGQECKEGGRGPTTSTQGGRLDCQPGPHIFAGVNQRTSRIEADNRQHATYSALPKRSPEPIRIDTKIDWGTARKFRAPALHSRLAIEWEYNGI